jgi:hypothetical protein
MARRQVQFLDPTGSCDSARGGPPTGKPLSAKLDLGAHAPMRP